MAEVAPPGAICKSSATMCLTRDETNIMYTIGHTNLGSLEDSKLLNTKNQGPFCIVIPSISASLVEGERLGKQLESKSQGELWQE